MSRVIAPFCCMALGITIGAFAQPADARERVQSITLESMPVDAALRKVSAITGRQIIFAPQSVAGRRSSAISGTYGIDQLLRRLLRGTSLVADTSSTVIVVKLRPSDPVESRTTEASLIAPVLAAPIADTQAEIIVTAMKRPTALRKTPASISTIRGEQIGVGPVGTLSDVMRQTPGMHIVQNGTTLRRIVLRGVQSAGEATTGVYYDETPVTGPAGSAADPGASQPALQLYDVDRVEILRGPQGTLYGAGSMGGTLKIILNKPDMHRFGANIEADATTIANGSPGHAVRAVVNAPLIRENLAIRAVGYSELRGGYIDNTRLNARDVNRNRIDGGRLMASFQASSALRINLTAAHQNTRFSDATTYWYPRLGRYKTDSNIVGEYDARFSLLSGTAELTLPLATITAAVSNYAWRQRISSDYTPTLARALDQGRGCPAYFGISDICSTGQLETFKVYGETRLPAAWTRSSDLRSSSAEVRLSSRATQRYQWTFGAFIEHRRDDFDSYVYRTDALSGRVLAMRGDETGYRTIDNAIDQEAVFGEISWLPADQWNFTIGARYYDYDIAVGGRVIIPDYITGSNVQPYSRTRTHFASWVNKLSASYQLTDSTLLYATTAEGFRPGGVNNVPGAGDSLPKTYLPDRLRSYELGVKSRFFYDHVAFAIALYSIDWRSMQISAKSPNGAWYYLTNAGRARIRGGELEMDIRATRSLGLHATAAVVDARLLSDQSSATTLPTATTGLAGDRIPFVPRRTASLSASYRKSWASIGKVEGRINFACIGPSASEFRPSLPIYEKQPAYGLLGAQLTFSRGNTVLELSMSNLLNSTAPLRIVSSKNGIRHQTISEDPRSIVIGIQLTF